MKNISKKTITIIVIIICSLLMTVGLGIWVILYNLPPKILNFNIAKEINDDGTKTVSVMLSSNNNRDIYCKINKPDELSNNWIKANQKTCTFAINYNDFKLYIKYNHNKIIELTEKLDIEEVIHLGLTNRNQYLAVGATMDLKAEIKAIGNPKTAVTFYVSDENIAMLENDQVIGIAPGTVIIKAVMANGLESSLELIVTDLISDYKLNNKKTKLPCNHYTKEEATILDKILIDIINAAGGKKTRGAVIAVARFLPLQFKYKIPYFFENGRLAVYDKRRKVDGEGRYYHEGLYLHKDKIKELDQTKIGWGPAIWGCGLTNWDTSYGWIRGAKYPNGLDCSGFVSWALLNAGYDVKDLGSGFADWPSLDDYGETHKLTYEYANKKTYKVGDLIGRDGHIAIIAGMDEKNLYIAESLLSGVVIETFSYVNPNSKLYKLYGHIIEMDKYYGKEGYYSEMW